MVVISRRNHSLSRDLVRKAVVRVTAIANMSRISFFNKRLWRHEIAELPTSVVRKSPVSIEE